MLDAVTPYGPGAGSSRVRVHEWARRVDAVIRVHPYAGLDGADPRLLARHPMAVVAAERSLRQLAGRRPSRLLLHREASPLSRGGLERSLLHAAPAAVYDFDDALYADTGAGSLYRRIAPKSAKVVAAARAADRVVAGNETLADWAGGHCADVVVVPSCVDPADYDLKTAFTVADPPRLGWVGSWSTEVHLAAIAAPLLELHRRLRARLVVVGSVTGHLGELETMVDRVPWSPAAQRSRVATFDVGLMPLIDTPYARGKCGYKLLQYLAAGVPSVASPVGVNAMILDRAGLPAATTTSEWHDALESLLTMPADGRAALGDRARELVRTEYSYAAWEPRWRAAMFLDPMPAA